MSSCNAGGVVDEMNESGAVDATPNQHDIDVTFSHNADKPSLSPAASVADASPPPVGRSPTLAADVDSIMPGDAVSDDAIASIAGKNSRVRPTLSPSHTTCHQSLSPARISMNPAEMSEREEDDPEQHSRALSGIVHIAFVIRCFFAHADESRGNKAIIRSASVYVCVFFSAR